MRGDGAAEPERRDVQFAKQALTLTLSLGTGKGDKR
jgi:hypothetical protein